MPLTFETILRGSGIHPAETQAIRHVFADHHEDSGESGLRIDSTDQEILDYTASQSADPRRFPLVPPRYWVVFMREGGHPSSIVESTGESGASVCQFYPSILRPRPMRPAR